MPAVKQHSQPIVRLLELLFLVFWVFFTGEARTRLNGRLREGGRRLKPPGGGCRYLVPRNASEAAIEAACCLQLPQDGVSVVAPGAVTVSRTLQTQESKAARQAACQVHFGPTFSSG